MKNGPNPKLTGGRMAPDSRPKHRSYEMSLIIAGDKTKYAVALPNGNFMGVKSHERFGIGGSPHGTCLEIETQGKLDYPRAVVG